MTKETKDRIAREALREYPANRYMSDDLFFTRQAQQESYISGAEAWAERAQGLVEGLKTVVRCCLATGPEAELRDVVINDILKEAEKTLTKYNNSK